MAGLAGNWCCPGQHQEKGLYRISPAQEKLKIQSTVSAEWVSLLHHLSGESVRWTIASWGILYSEYRHRSLFHRGSRFLFKLSLIYERTSQVAQMVKNLPAMREPRVPSLGWKDSLEKGTAIHFGILGWRIPWTKEPDGLQFMESQRVRQQLND